MQHGWNGQTIHTHGNTRVIMVPLLDVCLSSNNTHKDKVLAQNLNLLSSLFGIVTPTVYKVTESMAYN